MIYTIDYNNSLESAGFAKFSVISITILSWMLWRLVPNENTVLSLKVSLEFKLDKVLPS